METPDNDPGIQEQPKTPTEQADEILTRLSWLQELPIMDAVPLIDKQRAIAQVLGVKAALQFQQHAAVSIASSLERIANALETLASTVTPRVSIPTNPEPPIGQRCQVCQGTGIKTIGEPGKYCEWCSTGRDLKRLHKDAPGASA